MRWKSLWSFSSLVWLLVAGLAFHALCWPLLQNVWAYYRWERVPCKLLERGGYSFVYADRAWVAGRTDFWNRGPVLTYRTDIMPNRIDTICYVAPGDPINTVLRLDAHQHLDRAAPGLIIVVLAACVASILTYVSRKTARKRPGPRIERP